MATSNAQRFLASGGDDRALALKMFWGTVLEAFRNKTLLWNSIGGAEGVGSENAGTGIVASKTVDAGKSWQFPIIGDDPTPEYHTPGTELLGQAVSLTEGTITIDDILVSHYDVPLDQTQLSHFDVLEPFARKLGRSLAIDFDKKLIQTGLIAAATAASSGFHNGGNSVERVGGTVATAYPNTSTGASNFRKDVAELARLMDEDNVPEDSRYLVITPYIRQVLTNDTTVFNKDFSDQTNDLNTRLIGILEGFQVMKPTNQMPSTDITTGPSKYQGDWTIDSTGTGTAYLRPVALALCGAEEGQAGIGYVAATGEAGPIYAHRHFDERRNTTFMKAQMMVGAGVLAPYCAGSIVVDDA
jgi:hypothetical protein